VTPVRGRAKTPRAPARSALRDAEAFLRRQRSLPGIEGPTSPQRFVTASRDAIAYGKLMRTLAARGRRTQAALDDDEESRA
jgi:hypothetical protein